MPNFPTSALKAIKSFSKAESDASMSGACFNYF